MSIHLQSLAWKFKFLDLVPSRQQSTTKIVLVKLCDNASDEGYCWPSIGRIAEECCLGRSTVTKQITILESIGLVSREYRFKDNIQRSNGYFINIPMLTSLIPTLEEGETPSSVDTEPSLEPSIKKIQTTFDKVDEIFIQDLNVNEFKNCHSMIEEMKRYEYFYTGKLTLDEWSECENQMNVDTEFDPEFYVEWFVENRLKSFRKKPSLKNLVSDMNGITFNQFYDSILN